MGTLEGFHPLPRWCAAGKPAGSPRARQQWTDHADGRTLPKFVLDELHGFMACGILGRGLAHLYCEACGQHHVVAFSVRLGPCVQVVWAGA